MTPARFPLLDKYLLGAVLLLAMVLGGNSAPGFWLDHAIQLAMILASGVVIWRTPGRKVDPRLLAMILAIAGAVALQLVPLPTAWMDAVQGIVERADPELVPAPSFRPVSLAIGRTLEALLWVLACGWFAVAVARIDFEHAHGLVPIFLIGVLFHLVAGLTQYSAAGGRPQQSLLGFELGAGFFANSNHFSALAFVSIPLAFAYFFDRRRLSLFLAYLLATLLILLAVGSRAGVMIGLAITLLSSLILFRRGARSTLAILLGAMIAGVYALGVWSQMAQQGLESSGRAEFARTTWQAILDNPVFGIGYGGFVTAYPAYERTESIFATYVNHAHNDFLELILEGGIPALALLAAAIVLLAIRFVETVRWPLHFACTLSLAFLLVHSLVDYPLRTLAISASFSLMAAILFHHGARDTSNRAESRRKGKRRARRKQTGMVEASA